MSNPSIQLNVRRPKHLVAKFARWAALCLALSVLIPIEACAHENLIYRISLLNEEIRTNGNSGELLLQRAELYRAHQDWLPALRDYDAAEQGLTNSGSVDLGRALALAGWGKSTEARVVFDRVILREPTNAVALLRRARVLAQLQERALAIVDYSMAFHCQPNPHPDDYLARARLQALESDHAAAIVGLDEGLARLGWMVTLELQAMEYEQACGNYDGALARLDAIITRANRLENWLRLKGEMLQKAGRLADARAAFDAALKAIDVLPPRLAQSETVIELRVKIERSLKSLSPTVNVPTLTGDNADR